MGRGERRSIASTSSLELDLAGREGFVLHDHSAARCQNHDVQILLPLVGLLVPLPGHLRIMSRDEGHLKLKGNKMETMTPGRARNAS